MRTLVVYDSVHGNTEQVAASIGGAVSGPARVLPVKEVTGDDMKGVELLIVGSPTHGGKATKAVMDFLGTIPPSALADVAVAAFDTRLPGKLVGVFGFAAGKVMAELTGKGGVAIGALGGFVVVGRSGPLQPGERTRAAEWARALDKQDRSASGTTPDGSGARKGMSRAGVVAGVLALALCGPLVASYGAAPRDFESHPDPVADYSTAMERVAGLRAAVQAARWLGKTEQADDWRKEYDDFYATFRRAAERDMATDPSGNRYLPIRMGEKENVPPQKAQWAFCHAVYPGEVFDKDDPLVLGNLAMLMACEKEGLVAGTGWLWDGIWNYFASFYAHAWLWEGDGDKAGRTLYAFANHASPLLAWREEQMQQGQGDQICGDMPHNWGSAEFIRLVRHMLILERGDELHLFEGFPAKWAKPGSITRVREVLTDFGPISLEFRVSEDGKKGVLKIDPPTRSAPGKIILHLDRWSSRRGTIELPTAGPVEKEIDL